MRVLRGSAGSPDADARVTADLLSQVAETGDPLARVWRPAPHVSFGPRDVRDPGYAAATEAATSRGFAVVERSMGGRPVAFSGRSLALVRADPPADDSIADRYERVGGPVANALAGLGVPVEWGSPPGAFCPGTYGLSAGGKLVGLAQRVRSDVAAVGGVLLVDDHAAIADVLVPVYRALELDLDPDAIGSIGRAGVEVDPDRVAAVLAATLESSRDGPPDRTL